MMADERLRFGRRRAICARSEAALRNPSMTHSYDHVGYVEGAGVVDIAPDRPKIATVGRAFAK
jgi:hypothetical protein